MMKPFRENTPARDPDRKECVKYYSYKDTLRKDFNRRCGYCDDNDQFRIRSYTIDHFIPRNPKGFTHTIAPNCYQNLVWACSACNLAKSNKWPTSNPSIHNDGSVGFVDPVDENYSALFERSGDGRVLAKDQNVLATNMINELKLWLPIHSVIWKLEKVLVLEKQVKNALEQLGDGDLKQELKSLHYEIMEMTLGTIREMFAEND